MFESYEKWPTYLPLRDGLQAHWQAMRQEALSLIQVKGAYVAWPERGIYRGQWDVFGLRWQLLPDHFCHERHDRGEHRALGRHDLQ